MLNALRGRLLDEVSEALREMERNDAVRAIVITGAGEKAFAAGADITELNALAIGRIRRRPSAHAGRPSRVKSSVCVNP